MWAPQEIPPTAAALVLKMVVLFILTPAVRTPADIPLLPHPDQAAGCGKAYDARILHFRMGSLTPRGSPGEKDHP